MAHPRAFLSFDFDHNDSERQLFAGQAKSDSPTPFVVEDWSSKYVLPQNQWQRLISEKINRCHLMIVLVGRHMGSATGVGLEIAMAKTGGVPYFGVYVDGAGDASTLPAGLPRNRIVAWRWSAIGDAIRRMMGEGKNA